MKVRVRIGVAFPGAPVSRRKVSDRRIRIEAWRILERLTRGKTWRRESPIPLFMLNGKSRQSQDLFLEKPVKSVLRMAKGFFRGG